MPGWVLSAHPVLDLSWHQYLKRVLLVEDCFRAVSAVVWLVFLEVAMKPVLLYPASAVKQRGRFR